MRALVCFVLLVAVAAPAHAASPAEAEAKQRYTHAQKLFDAAEYAPALDEFQRAYELSHYPAILYKVALCRDQLGQIDEAIEAYRKYLDADPTSTRKAGVEQRIQQLKALSRPTPEAPPAPAPVAAPTAPPVAAPTSPAAVAPASPSAPTPQAASTLTSAPPAPTPAYKKWWVWTLVGVGAAGVAVGLGVGLTAGRSPTPDSFNPTLGRIGPGLSIH